MIYEGKEYVEVTDGSAEIGDLIHVTNTSGAECDVWCFSNDDNFETPCVESALPGSYYCLDNEFDDYKRYRYLKDVDETPTNVFKEGDRVKIVGESWNGVFANIGLSGVIRDEADCDGDYTVDEIGPYSNYVQYPPSSLKLIENNTEKAHRELNQTIIKIDKEMIKHLKKSKKAHDLIKQTSKNITQTDTVNSPSHYNQTKIEAIDIIEDVTAGYQSNVKYHIGNAIKYLIRAPFKNNTVEDLKKAVWYIQRAIEKLEGEK